MAERRTVMPLSDEQIEEIADRAANKAVAKMTADFYQQIGKGFMNKLFTVAGLVAVGIYAWLAAHGYTK